MRATTLALSTRRTDDVLVIEAAGEIDIATIGRLEEALTDGVAAAPAVLEVDLRGVFFMDSTGVWLLTRFAALADVAAWSLSVVPSAAVRRVLDVSGVTGRIPLAERRTVAA
ncbi:MAG TPA: STAS domain-containing protein [Solirubrobacteraceae bacterium]|nr:STAS domain-containing protein [Solirubrobacteraceae bacterium]